MDLYLVDILYLSKAFFYGGGGALCFEWGFTWTFPGNQDVAVKKKFEVIYVKFPVVYQRPKFSAENESFQSSAFGFGRRI